MIFGVFTGALGVLAVFSDNLSSPLWWLETSAVAGIAAAIGACIQVLRAQHGGVAPNQEDVGESHASG